MACLLGRKIGPLFSSFGLLERFFSGRTGGQSKLIFQGLRADDDAKEKKVDL